MKMAQVHFDEVEVKDNEYYAILLLHLKCCGDILFLFYTWFSRKRLQKAL